MQDYIDRAAVSAYSVPTETPEADGTAEWASTTVVVVQLDSQGETGLGYTYAHECCAPLIRKTLFPIVSQKPALSRAALVAEMNTAVRNFGHDGIASSAMAAVEMALWDLECRQRKVPVAALLGVAREKIPVYGSGGFTSYSDEQLTHQFAAWVEQGISMVKMKVGKAPKADPARVAVARRAIGDAVQLFVDANGAYSIPQSLELAAAFSAQNVQWFEEPVSSDNLSGLRFIREHRPVSTMPSGGGAGSVMEIAAGEYNYNVRQALHMLQQQAVDVLQADATRCGITGFLQMAALCEAFETPLSAHTAPALHAHLCCAVNRARHVEYFFDHARIEQMFFEGPTTEHNSGFLKPDFNRPGFGLEFKEKDAAKFKVNI